MLWTVLFLTAAVFYLIYIFTKESYGNAKYERRMAEYTEAKSKITFATSEETQEMSRYVQSGPGKEEANAIAERMFNSIPSMAGRKLYERNRDELQYNNQLRMQLLFAQQGNCQAGIPSDHDFRCGLFIAIRQSI